MQGTTRRNVLLGSAGLAAWLATVAARPPQDAAGVPAGGPGAAPDAERQAFLRAVASGDLDAARARLDARAELADACDAQGRSALVLACLGGHAAVVRLLLERGATVGLAEAVMVPDWERAQELVLDEGVSLEAWLPVGGTALYAAARAGEEGLWHLQAWGADPDGNPRGPRGVTPAHGALRCPDRGGAIRALVGLLSNGGHVNARQRDGDSLLHAAARRGDAYLVGYLLRRGADDGARDARGSTALDQARELGHTAVVALLERAGGVPRDDPFTRYAWDASGERVRWPDLSDLSGAEQAAVTGPSHFDLAAVRALVDPDPRRSFSRSYQDELAVEASGHTGASEIARLHLEHGVPQSLCTSLSIGDLARARAILAAHPGAVHERGPHDFPPLWYASIGGGSVEAAELLLAAGAPVDQESQLTTAVHQAASRGQVELLRFLAGRGADLERVGYKWSRAGHTPLAIAAERGRDAAVRTLRELGAS